MKRILAPILLIAMVISVSGCTGDGSFAGINFMQSNQENEAPSDVLEIQREKVVPTPPIRAGDKFEFSFLLKNIYNTKDAESVSVDLYDHGKCSLEEGDASRQFESLYGGSSKIIDWKFKAPDSNELGDMSGACNLKYKIKYEFDAYTRADLTVASKQAIEQASRAGESIQTSTSVSKSQGPLKIDISFQRQQPFIEGTTIPFELIIQNKGSGTPSSLDRDDIEISLGDESLDEECNYPTAGSDETELIFLDGATPPIKCDIPPEMVKTGGGPTEEYTVQVDVKDYEYELLDEESVSVETGYESVESEDEVDGDENDGEDSTTDSEDDTNIPDRQDRNAPTSV